MSRMVGISVLRSSDDEILNQLAAAGTFSALIPTTAPTMPIALHRDSDGIYRLEISGLLRKEDYRRCEAELKTELDRVGSAKLLCVLTGFEGWEAGVDWSDLSFYANYGDAVRRIAIVGNERWRSEMLMFAAADLRRGPVEFFSEGDLTKARAWIAG